VSFWVRDVNGNPMPAETTVALVSATPGVTVDGTASYEVPCSALPANEQQSGVTAFAFTLKRDATVSTGTVRLNVTVPSGLTTTLFVNVN
jgi:hypothetical protein